MNKIGWVAVIVVLTAISYLVIMLVMPILVGVTTTVNATLAPTSANHPGTVEVIVATPWVMWWVPGVISMALIAGILKRP